jgi:DNA-binding transcriptional MerR regulator
VNATVEFDDNGVMAKAKAEIPAIDTAPETLDDASVPAVDEYTIDELAAHTRVPSRTIRFYQAKGALPRPVVRGRTAYYGAAHVERLKLIADLQDRGLTIRAIRDLVARMEKGDLELGAWLGVEEQLSRPWANDAPRLVTEDELRDLVGSDRPGLVSELVRVGLVNREHGSFLVPSSALLKLALDLESAGVELEVASRAGELIRKHVARAAHDVVHYLIEHAGRGFGRSDTPDDIGRAIGGIRPKALEAAGVIFGQEVERTLTSLIQSGEIARATTRKPNRRK